MTANYVLLEKISVGAAGASGVTFSGIPQTGYTDLVVKCSARTSRSAVYGEMYMRLNGATTNYTGKALEGTGSSAGSYSETTLRVELNGDTSTANTFGSAEFYIPNYTSANYKSISLDSVTENNATAVDSFLKAQLWSNTAAITQIDIGFGTGTIMQYSTFYLYGVAAYGTTPAIQPYATGGDTIMTDGTYWYHAFKANGTFTPAKGLSCDVLVVAGGAGGSNSNGGGGGGGAGGIFYTTAQSLSSAQTVTIGAGGASVGYLTQGNSGTNTTIGALTAAVGGGKGAIYNSAAGNGGSGGGGSYAYAGGTSTQTGTGGTGYGNSGGIATTGDPSAGGGGGGGAGAVGGAGDNATVSGGVGGAGLNTWSSWLSTTGLGVSGYIAGGGGGGSYAGSVAPAGGSGGGGSGGRGAAAVNGTNATANTGSGGGGGGQTNTTGSGGSGLVIVRYAV